MKEEPIEQGNIPQNSTNRPRIGFFSRDGAVQSSEKLIELKEVKKGQSQTLYESLEDLFVAECRSGDIAKMRVLLYQGAALEKSDGAGVYPLMACLESLNMEAIHYLTDHIKREGSDAWSIVDLSVLEVTLNKLRPQPLEAKGESNSDKQITYGALYRCYKVNEVKCREDYDQQYGRGQYCEAICNVAKVARNYTSYSVMKGPHWARELVKQLCLTIDSRNKQVDAVLAYAKEQLVTASTTLGV